MTTLSDSVDWEKGGGIAPAIVQDAVTGRVLMLGYMNIAALEKTTASGLVTFYSRSRQCLWTKGESSGNKLELEAIALDCDGDTLLVTAIPAGPTCHRSTSSCFDGSTEQPGFGFLGQLEQIISDRVTQKRDDSYTVRLMNAGVQRIAQKVGEEGVEVALAGLKGDREELVAEAADLVFHLLVLLNEQDLSFADVALQLAQRNAASERPESARSI